MKKARVSKAVLLGFVLLCGCSSSEREETLRTEIRFTTGEIYFSGQFVESRKLWKTKLLRSGEWLWFYPNGNVFEKTEYGKGGKVKSDWGYFENGELEWKIEYSETGVFETYYGESGEIRWTSYPIQQEVVVGDRVVNWEGEVYSEYSGGRIFYQRFDFETNLRTYEKIYSKDGEIIYEAFMGDDYYKDHIVAN